MTAVSFTEGKCKQRLSRVLGKVEGSYRSLISDYVHPIVSSHPALNAAYAKAAAALDVIFNGRTNTHAHTKA